MIVDNKIARKILKLIKEYQNILIFRHDSPDFDALGSQFGMYHFLKENFKDKNIYAPGFSNVPLAPGLYPSNDVLDESIYNSKFLGIVLDTGNTKRISDENYSKADKIIKIDHHPNVEPYGEINLVMPEQASCSELVYYLFKSLPFRKYKINNDCAKYLYSGIVGDTGRFQFSSTLPTTLQAGADLVKHNFNMTNDVYMPMYRKDFSHFKATRFVLNNFSLSKGGCAYYHMHDKDLKELGLDADEAKEFLSLFNYYNEIKVWCCFVEDVRKQNWRGSIRSRNIVINEVCSKYNGGGHSVAAGCRLKDYDESLKMIDDIDKEISKQEGK